jgi:hypothetical protein
MDYAIKMLSRINKEKKSEIDVAANSAAILIQVLVSGFIGCA